MLLEFVEVVSGIVGTGALSSLISYRLGKKKGIKEAPKAQCNIEAELKEVEEFLNPGSKLLPPPAVDLGQPKKKKDIISWCFLYKPTEVFRCPKCSTGITRTDSNWPRLCECDEYKRSHFHFNFCRCGYDAIMKTSDDSGN